MTLEIRKASRKFRPIKFGIGGITGSGKSIGMLKVAFGICGDWDKICVIDSENNSIDLYDNLGKFSVLPLKDISPNGYVEAIKKVESSGFEVCCIDSISHEWTATLDLADKTAKASRSGNSFAAWGEVTPIHNKFISTWLDTPMHIIATMRQKDDFVMEQNEKGKMTPRRVGLKNIQRDGVDYEFDVLLTISGNHYCTVEKDRTQLFDGKPAFMLDETVGKQLIDWSNKGPKEIKPTKESIVNRILLSINEIKDKELRNKINLIVGNPSNTEEMLLNMENRVKQILGEQNAK
jgi:hypothetical protein